MVLTKNIQNLQQKIGYVIGSEASGAYSENEQITFLTKSIESSLCDYSDAYILVTGNITSGGNDTKAAFKNCAPFRTYMTQINETFVDEAKHINITMQMYNLTEYGDNYSDTSGSLWQFKRDKQPKKIMETFLMLAQITLHLLNTNQILLVPFQMVEEKME